MDRIGYYVRSDRYPIIMLVAYDKAYVRGLRRPSASRSGSPPPASAWSLFILGFLLFPITGSSSPPRQPLREGAKQREVHFLEAMAGVPGRLRGSRYRRWQPGSGQHVRQHLSADLIHDYVASARSVRCPSP